MLVVLLLLLLVVCLPGIVQLLLLLKVSSLAAGMHRLAVAAWAHAVHGSGMQGRLGCLRSGKRGAGALEMVLCKCCIWLMGGPCMLLRAVCTDSSGSTAASGADTVTAAIRPAVCRPFLLGLPLW